MSKATELRAVRYARSIDAPRTFHKRSGEESGAGSMLDYYAQVESAEEVYFGQADELAREKFVKGFKVYLQKVFTAQEREFLARLMAGKESAYKIGRSLGVEHFEFLQSIQRKAFKNAKPLIKFAKKTGWSGAEEFTHTIYERLRLLQAGFSVNEILPQNAKIEKFREKKNAIMRRWRANNYEHHREYMAVYMAQWREDNREHLRAISRAYYAANIERERARKRERWEKVKAVPELYESELSRARAYYAANAEERREKDRKYFAENREEINAKNRAYYEANKERILARRNTPEKRKKHSEYMKEYNKAHRAEEREYRRARYAKVRKRKLEMARKWREANREHVREINRAAQRRYYERKKAERLALAATTEGARE